MLTKDTGFCAMTVGKMYSREVTRPHLLEEIILVAEQKIDYEKG